MNSKKYNLLIVDDEINIIRSIIRVLDNDDYNFVYTVDPLETVDILRNTSIDVIISDQRMPNMTGLELLTKAKTISPSSVRILMSAFSDIDIVIKAINDGQIYQYITKPWDNDKLINTINSAIEYKSDEDEKEKILAYSLEKIENWNTVINQMNSELERKKENSIKALLKVLKAKDMRLYGHCFCVSETASLLAEMMELSTEQIEAVRYAGLFHDVGKIAIRDKIMYKAGSLEDDEFAEMKHHPLVGAEILREVDFLGTIADIVEQHHERIDGKGYPKGLFQRDIILEAQIIAVADNFEALRENRIYRDGMSAKDAMHIITEGIGTRFNPDIVNVLERAIKSASVNCANSKCSFDEAL